jgi:hypothetical protein
VQLWGRLTAVTSVASLSTSHTAAPARSLSQADRVDGEKAWWELGQEAVRPMKRS